MIARKAHFIWLGPVLPDLAWLAIRSAIANGGFDSVTLWTADPALAATGKVAALVARHGVTVVGFANCPELGKEGHVARRLDQLMALVRQPAAKADLWRLRVIWAVGGVYLDSDAIVLRDFGPLLVNAAFVGKEHVCLPASLYRSGTPLKWAKAVALLALRHSLTLRRGAGKRFGHVARLFDQSCNNAVFGAQANSACVMQLLQRAAALPDSQALQLYELGPRLWEAQTANQSSAACTVLPPQAFYPLGPEICADYVAVDRRGSLGVTPDAGAFAAHLYDSVLTRRLGHPITAQWLLAHQSDTLLGRMVQPWIAELVAIG